MSITQRIDRLITSTIMESGAQPVGLILGPDQMEELIAFIYPAGRTAVQVRQGNPTQYAGLRLSEQPGVDGVVVVTQRVVRTPLPSGPADLLVSTRCQYVGAYPILF